MAVSINKQKQMVVHKQVIADFYLLYLFQKKSMQKLKLDFMYTSRCRSSNFKDITHHFSICCLHFRWLTIMSRRRMVCYALLKCHVLIPIGGDIQVREMSLCTEMVFTFLGFILLFQNFREWSIHTPTLPTFGTYFFFCLVLENHTWSPNVQFLMQQIHFHIKNCIIFKLHGLAIQYTISPFEQKSYMLTKIYGFNCNKIL